MSGHNCISLPPMQSGPGAFFGFRCLISNPTSSLHIGSMKNEFITLAGKYSLYLPPQSGNSDFKTSPIVQKWLFLASDILFLSLMNFPSINDLLIEIDFDPALGFIMRFRVFHILYREFLLLSKTSWLYFVSASFRHLQRRFLYVLSHAWVWKRRDLGRGIQSCGYHGP